MTVWYCSCGLQFQDGQDTMCPWEPLCPDVTWWGKYGFGKSHILQTMPRSNDEPTPSKYDIKNIKRWDDD